MVNSNYVSTRFKHNSIVFLLFFAVAFLALSEPAYAQLGETKVIASDGAADDVFGWSVSISGDYAVVGAFQDDDDGSLSGSAYIYMRSGTAWSQQAKLTASDGAAGEEFGWSVSISGDYAVVGARWDDDNGISSGSAYIFKRTGTSWAQEAKLVASDGAAGDEFGFSVSISGDYTIVGAEGDDDNGSLSGSAYVFKRTGTSWAEQEKLLASDGAFGDKFGGSVSISGDDAVVGAIHDQDNGSFSGSAYVFKRSGTTWTQEAKLLPSDGAASEEFGISVSISGDYAVVGAWEDDNDNGSESGSAYVYMRSGTTWSQQAKLLSSDGAASDNFGISVAISGDIVVVGAWTSDVDAVETGSAYVFNRTGTSWAQEAKLAASDGAAFDEFGFSVSISDGYTIVAAPSDDDDGSASGSAYLFKLNTAPVITSSATASGTEDVAFSYTATATDAENDALTFTFSALSSWLSASGAVVTGTPTEGVTSGSFRVVVSDGSLTNTLDVSITVAAVNDAPVITSSATATGTEDVAFSYTATATDAENDALTFTFSALSSWLSASGAVVTGTPTEGVTSGSFRVVVSDGSLTNTLDVSITVAAVNDAPVITSSATATGTEDVAFSYYCNCHRC